MKYSATLVAAAALVLPAAAQLSGSVGPLTTYAEKAATKTCNILDYGGTASATTDNSDAIASAWADCKSGGEVYIPEGDYGLDTWVTLTGGEAVSIRLDGIIYRTGTDGGNMIFIEHTTDFEMYSSTSAGGIQGYGYEFLSEGEYGPRLLRLASVTSFSVHDIILVDSPAFHFTMDTCTDGEVYNMVIRGANEGGLDGIDVWGSNIWIHDVEVTNKDECVTVKSPADHILVEQVFCNWSGGCAMGSLGADTDISNIEYNHVYTQSANQMYMIKSNGGSGTVENVILDTFTGHSNAYTLDFDSYWSSMSEADGDGVQYSNISFSNWSGTCDDGTERGPIKVFCPSGVPCYDISITDFNVGSESGDTIYFNCENSYGEGGCLASGDDYAAYTTTLTSSAPTVTVATMDGEMTEGLGLTVSIAYPTMPASFYPGSSPSSAFMADSFSSSDAAAASTTAATTPVATSAAATSASASSSAKASATSSPSAVSSFVTSVVAVSSEEATSAPAAPTQGSWGNEGGHRGGHHGN